MFNEGGPAAPVAPVTPVVPAPAPVAPVTVPLQQHSLADAQITAPVTLPSVAPAPVAPSAPVIPASPDPAAVADQRVKDAQRRMHEATAETARVRNQLHSILTHPQLGPVIQKVTNPQAPTTPQEDEVKVAFKAWQAAPTDEDAFRHLLATSESRAKKAVLADLQAREEVRVNQARAQQRDLLVANAINKEVTDKAPDVPLELFWAMSSKAETETPMHLVTVADKLEWQIGRAVALARDVLTSRTQVVTDNQRQSQQVRGSAAVVMSPGGAAPGTGGASSSGQPTFVDQLKAAQARRIPATT